MASLDQLERDVERARARFAEDLARLRDPHTLAQAKAEVVDKARAYKDEAVGEARDGVTSKAQGLVEDVKQRLTDNPTAAVLIGAGIAYHLIRKPPITTLLVGSGLFALFRPDMVEDLKQQVSGTVQDRLVDARDRLADARDVTTERARDVADRVSALADQANARVSDQMQPVMAATSDLEEAVRERVEESPLLYSLAAAAVGAAIGVTAKRRGTFRRR